MLEMRKLRPGKLRKLLEVIPHLLKGLKAKWHVVWCAFQCVTLVSFFSNVNLFINGALCQSKF